MAENSDEKTSTEEVLRLAKERFKICKDAYADIHKAGRLDDEFRVGDQWPDEVKRDRESEGRPCLTVNRLAQFVRQVVNDQKQNNPTATYTPEDDKADVETAQIYQGLNRNIEKSSNADGARDWAFDGAAGRGFGYFRLTTDYVSPTSFLQEIRYAKVFDSYGVYLDPNHVEVDGSDAAYGFVFKRTQKDEFKAKYGKAKLSKDDNWELEGTADPDWIDESSCLEVEYYYKDFKKEPLYLLSNGESYTRDVLKTRFDNGLIPEGVSVVDERETVTALVKWIKFAGNETLDSTEWKSQWIPIIPVYGEVQIINGKKVLKSVIRDSHDSQRMLNYFVSSEAEAIALTPKAPFVGAAGQFEGFEDKWSTANTRPHSFLEYNPIDINGTPVPAPQRVIAEAQVQSITQARVQAQEDLKATTGIYDAALGARSNENSGIAIQRRANQAQTSNYHFMANFEQSVKHGARIVAELIPVIYDTPRAAKILGEDGESEIIRINEEFDHNGERRTYDLSKGKYDLSVDMGPAYATKRQEALASMLEIAKMNPQVMQIAGDLIIKNMDWPGAQEFVERIKRTMDPKLLDDKAQQVPPQVQAQLAQMGQVIQQMQAINADLQKKLEMKVLELQSKERIENAKLQSGQMIEAAKLETDLIKEQMKLPTDQSLMQMQQQLAELQNWQNQLVQYFEPSPTQIPNEAGLEGQPSIQIQQPTGGQPGSYME